MAWNDILDDPEFQGQDREVKTKVAKNYFDSNFATEPDFQAQPEEERGKVYSNFLSTLDKPVVQKDDFAVRHEASRARMGLPPMTEGVEEAGVEDTGEFVKGVQRGIPALKETGYGMAALAGSVVEDVIPAIGKPIKEWGIEHAREKADEVAAIPAEVPTISDIEGIGTFGKWAAGMMGEQVPNILETALTSLAGAAIGSAATPAGTIAGAATGLAAKRVIKGFIKKEVKKLMKAGMKKEAAEKAAGKIVGGMSRKLVGKKIGANIGMAAGVYPLETGGNYMEAYEEGHDNPYSAMLTGAGSTALEFMGGSHRLIEKFIDPMGELKGLFKHTFKALQSAPEEALQEMGQEFLSKINVWMNDPTTSLTDKESVMRYLNSGAAGLLLGTAFGTAGEITEAGKGYLGKDKAVPLDVKPEEKPTHTIDGVPVWNVGGKVWTDGKGSGEIDESLLQPIKEGEAVSVADGIEDQADIDKQIKAEVAEAPAEFAEEIAEPIAEAPVPLEEEIIEPSMDEVAPEIAAPPVEEAVLPEAEVVEEGIAGVGPQEKAYSDAAVGLGIETKGKSLQEIREEVATAVEEASLPYADIVSEDRRGESRRDDYGRRAEIDRLVAAGDREGLHKLVYQDQLTGMLNRKAFYEAEPAAIEQGKRVVSIDMSGLKYINDNFHHKGGDALLNMVASTLEGVKGSDAFRVGGDEFAMFIDNVEESSILLDEAKAELANMDLEVVDPDGTTKVYTGFNFDYGEGDYFDEADAELTAYRDKIKLEGKRKGREGQPYGLAEKAPEGLDIEGRRPEEEAREGIEAPSTVQEEVEVARQEVEAEPTEAQIKAGNYKKGHVKVKGLDLTIENPKGSERTGIDDGREWNVTMHHDYGYIKKSEGADGDHVDIYLGENPESDQVFVVHQIDPTTRKFDEEKVMLGFDTQEEAEAAYRAQYDQGMKDKPNRIGSITPMTMEEFKSKVYEKGPLDKKAVQAINREALKKPKAGKKVVPVTPAVEEEVAEHNGEPATKAETGDILKDAKKEAKDEGVTPAEQKTYLLSEIDKGLKEAPSEAELEGVPPRDYGRVKIEVPGDGTFDIINTKEALTEFKSLVKKNFPGKEAAKRVTRKHVLPKPTAGKAKALKDVRQGVYEGKPYHTDGHVILLTTPILKPTQVKDSRWEDKPTIEADTIKDLIPKGGDKVTNVEFVGYEKGENQSISKLPIPDLREDKRFTGAPKARLISEKGEVYIGQEYYNYVIRHFPNATFYTTDEVSPVLVKDGKKTVGIVMPIRIEDVEVGVKEVRMPKEIAAEKAQVKIEEAIKEPTPKFSDFKSGRVRIGKSPQAWKVLSEATTKEEEVSGERYFEIENEKTGEKQTVTFEEMKPIKAKEPVDIPFKRREDYLGEGLPVAEFKEVPLRADIEAMKDIVTTKWKNAPPIHVRSRVNQLPSHLLDAVTLAKGEKDIEGIFDPETKSVYLIAGNIDSLARAKEVLFHESLGHFGIRGLLGKDITPVLNQVYIKYRKEAQEIATQYDFDVSKAEGRRQAAEEVLANIAQKNSDVSLLKKVYAVIRNWLRKMGIDIKLSDNDIRSMMAQAADFTREGKKPLSMTGLVAYSKRAPAPVYFSKLQETIADKMSTKAPVNTVRGIIKDVKAEEVKWSGIEDFLTDKKTVKRDDLLTFLQANEVQVKEISKKAGRNIHGEILSGDTKYSKYTLPGGENYKEMLLVLPKPFETELAPLREQLAKGKITDIEFNERAVAIKRKYPEAAEFIPSHWDVPNVLAHVRFNERTDAEGNKVLFLEEVQSDWALEARKKGVKPTPKETEALQKELDDIKAEIDSIYKEAGIDTSNFAEIEAFKSDRIDEISVRGREINSILSVDAVPAAPFIQKNWHELALKRMLRYAAENDFDSVAWITGQQTADRYDLSKKIDNLEYVEKDGTGTIVAYKDGDVVIEKDANTNSEIESIVGKSVAERLLGAESKTQGPFKIRAIEGEELKVGGEWAFTLYDKVIPNFLKKYGKKWGAKVGESDIGLGDRTLKVVKVADKAGAQSFEVRDLEGNVLGTFKNPSEADSFKKESSADFKSQQSIPITPEMKEAVLEGRQPMFARKEEKPSPFAMTQEEALKKAREAKTKAEKPEKYPSDKRDYTTTQKAALEKIAPELEPETVKERLNKVKENLGVKIKQAVVDQYASLKEFTEHGYILARMSNNSSGALEAAFRHGKLRMTKEGGITVDTTGEGLANVLAPLGGELNDFFAWIAGNRAERLKEEGREQLFSDKDINALKALNQGQMSDGKARTVVYAKIHKEFKDFQKSVLDIAEQSGLVDKEERETWEQDFYVPFYRILEDQTDVKGPKTLEALTGQTAIKQLKGADIKLNDLLSNVLMNWNHLLNASLKNNAAKVSLDAAVDMKVATPIKESEKTANSVFIRKNGSKVWYDVSEPLVLESLTSLNWDGFNSRALKAMRTFKRVFTVGVTASPEFRIANLLRDTIHSVAVGKMKYNMLDNALGAGWKGTKRDSITKARMMAGGGEIHFGHQYGADPDAARLLIEKGIKDDYILNNPKAFKNAKQALHTFWDTWKEFGSRLENVNRAALYEKRVKEVGELRANFEARDLMDFTNYGAAPAVRFLIQIVPFLNARMQGLYKLGGAAVDKDQQRQLAAVTSMVALASMALFLTFKDDDDFKEREEWDRDTYWWFKIPGSDKAFRLPKPFEVGAIGTLAERMLEQIVDDEAHGELFAERLGHMIVQTFAFSVVPQMLQPAIDVYSNINPFTDRPIESMGMERLSKTERKKAWTSETTIAISKGMDAVLWDKVVLSPVQIEYMVKGYLGWIGAMTLGTIDNIFMEPITGAPTDPTRRIDDYPAVGRFVRSNPSRNTKYATLFYEQLKEMNTAYSDVQNYRKLKEFKKAKESRQKNRDKLRWRSYFNSVQKDISGITRRMKLIQLNKQMTASEKRTQLDILQRNKNRKLKIAVERKNI